jgi:FkbM family methyltransferase
MNKLFEIYEQEKLDVKVVCEVGVYYPETSKLKEFIEKGIKAILVEADPLCVEKINEYFKGKNIQIYPYAVWDKEETVTLYRSNSSTFLEGINESPAIVNDNYKLNKEDSFIVESKLFSSIDKGDIDILSIDIEGAEWFVLKHLKSRPMLINIELRAGKYSNPYKTEIENWLNINNYKLLIHDDTDSIFYREGALQLSSANKISNSIGNIGTELNHGIQKLKRTIFKKDK